MKLRFHDGSLRLRLSQTDVARLAESGRVEEEIAFADGRNFVYAIELRVSAEIAASFDGGRIEVVVPEEPGRAWLASNEVGMENRESVPRILIEKDFKCLHGEAMEADAFPNPLMDKF